MRKRNKQFQNELIELRSLLRKYDYEVELMSVQQHTETDEFIKNLHRAKEKAGNLQRKYQEDDRLFGLETSQSASRLDKRTNVTALTSPFNDRDRKSATLERPIQELQTYLVTTENDRDFRRSRMLPTSPGRNYSSQSDLHATRDPITYRERKYSPKGTFYSFPVLSDPELFLNNH